MITIYTPSFLSKIKLQIVIGDFISIAGISIRVKTSGLYRGILHYD
jgi:hypothetical protein